MTEYIQDSKVSSNLQKHHDQHLKLVAKLPFASQVVMDPLRRYVMAQPIVPSERRHLVFPFPFVKATNGQVAIGQAKSTPEVLPEAVAPSLAKTVTAKRRVAIKFIL